MSEIEIDKKARELVDDMIKAQLKETPNMNFEVAKQCALIVVNKMLSLKTPMIAEDAAKHVRDWTGIKRKIENL